MPPSDAVSEPTVPDERYNPFTGRRIVPGVDDATPALAQLGLEPPRFCPYCRRRMVVQVVPRGWSARCARHGEL